MASEDPIDRRADSPRLRDPSAEAVDNDPLRQLFRRHANHFLGARAHQIHTRLKSRLFTERPGEPDSP